MKVALYHPWIYLKSGLERTILEVARRSRHQWTIYTSHYDADGTYPDLRDFGVRETHKVSVKRNYGAVLAASWRIARTRLELRDVDALVVCCDGVGSFITLRNRAKPALNLCFTPLRAIYDLEYRRRHLERQGRRRWLALSIEFLYRVVDRLVWRRYHRVVCISETVRDRVVSGGLEQASNMRVLYPGVDADQIAPSDRFENFFFLPGRIMWTKNIELGVEAFLKFKRVTKLPYRLVIAGMVDAKGEAYYAKLRALTHGDDDIVFHLSPSDTQMSDYYARCSASLFTAFNEDLGLTPMEAMARGKPVIAVDRGGPREVVEHDVTGFLVNADSNSFSVAMQLMVSDPERMRDMGRAGLERVRRFTWDRLVADLDDEIEAMVVSRR